MTTCGEVQRLLGRYLAMELAPEREQEVRGHLRECAICRAAGQEREPSLLLANAFHRETGEVEDDAFVSEVLAAVHQRRLESHLKLRRRRWLAAAAVLVGVLLVGLGTVRQAPLQGPAVAQRPLLPTSTQAAPPAVEVEGDSVRLYQFAGSASGEVQVAFIIDPGLEL